MENEIKNSLQIIFTEIDKMKDLTYSKIKDRNFENLSDIRESIRGIGLYDYLKQFEVYGRQYDVNTIIEGIKEYIDWYIASDIEKERWQ
jgi:hypothetical protein